MGGRRSRPVADSPPPPSRAEKDILILELNGNSSVVEIHPTHYLTTPILTLYLPDFCEFQTFT